MPVKKSKNTHQKVGKKIVRKSYKKPQKGAGLKKGKKGKNQTTHKNTHKKTTHTGGKLNAYFKLMLDAKKNDLPSFTYNGNTYKQFTAKTGLKMYKKA